MPINYSDSIAALASGAKVRRACWPAGDHVVYSRPAPFITRPPHILIHANGDHTGFVADANDIEASDWVVIDE